MNKDLILVIDIETDHIDCNVGSIVEIGICSLNLITGEIIEVFSSVVKDNKMVNYSGWIFKNSTLTKELVKTGIPIMYLCPLLQSLFDKHYLTAYNHKFDFEWLESRGLKIRNVFVDPMVVLTNIMKLPHSRYKYKFPKVTEAYKFLFDKDLDEKHRALSDAYNEAEIIREMAYRNYFTGVVYI